MPFLDSLVCFGSTSETVSAGDCDLERRIRVHGGAVETLEFAIPVDCVKTQRSDFSLKGWKIVVAQNLTKPPSNDDVAKLIAVGLPENTIVQVILKGPTGFDTPPDALINLKKQGASSKIIETMLGIGTNVSGLPTTATAQRRQQLPRIKALFK